MNDNKHFVVTVVSRARRRENDIYTPIRVNADGETAAREYINARIRSDWAHCEIHAVATQAAYGDCSGIVNMPSKCWSPENARSVERATNCDIKREWMVAPEEYAGDDPYPNIPATEIL